MEKIERFAEIRAWQMAKDLVADIDRGRGQGLFDTDYGLREQIKKASAL